MQVILTQFTPAQAARITGVSPGLQRQWRSAGYFRAAAGEGAHARFTAPELAGLMAARALVDGGLNYKQAASHLPRLSDAIHYWVIDYPGAMGDGGEDEARLRARDSYLNKLGGDQESGPFYLVLPGGAGEFIWDLDRLRQTFVGNRAAGATIVSVEAAAASLVAAAGCIGHIADPAGEVDELATRRLDRKAWLKAYRAAKATERRDAGPCSASEAECGEGS